MKHAHDPALIFVLSLLLAAGCKGKIDSDPASPAEQNGKAAPVDPAIEGSVSEFATLVGATPIMVTGYGVVDGLGDKGSREVPPNIRRRLIEQMNKYKIQPRIGAETAFSPEAMLDDLDTAVVAITGIVPPGVPKGTYIDLTVEALPQSQTSDLSGGWLLPADLSRVAVRDGRAMESRPIAVGRGAVFVNPFAEEGSADSSRLRRGRIIGGAVTEESQSLRLVLRQADYAMADAIQHRINERFGSNPKVANASSPSFIDLNIPPAYRGDYEHFLQLVMHLYVPGGLGMAEAKTRDLARDILLPSARHDDIALVWEAMGRNVLPMVRELYANENTAAAYHAARTGARLGDTVAVETIALFASNGGSPHQFEAIAELGRSDRVQAASALRALLDSEDDRVRIAAYEALSDSSFRSGIRRYDVDSRFVLDVVSTKGDFLIYATQTQVPKLVLFGENLHLRQPVFFRSADQLLTLHTRSSDGQLGAFRYVQDRLSSEFALGYDAENLILTLGRDTTADENKNVRGLALTYSQIVGVMHKLCKDKIVPAEFVLQRLPEASTIYAGGSSVGRPDTDEESALP